MKQKGWFPVIYMFLVTALFSSIVIGLSRYTQDQVEANEQLFFQRAVLQSLQLADRETKNVNEIFQQKIQPPEEKTHGAYIYEENGLVKGYALPVAGKGFWAPIRGVIGIGPDLEEIIGIAFYEQNETPGLGAEIETQEFRSRFEGLELNWQGQPVSFIAYGQEPRESEVMAITGATQTLNRLQVLLNNDLLEWKNKMGELNR